jgi:hypothetical protein
VQTKRPEGGHPGTLKQGRYRVVANRVELCDQTGRPLRLDAPINGMEPQRVAARLLNRSE